MSLFIRKNVALFCFLSILAVSSVGCGSNVEEGVADGPDEPEPVLTEEEVQGEIEATQNSN